MTGVQTCALPIYYIAARRTRQEKTSPASFEPLRRVFPSAKTIFGPIQKHFNPFHTDGYLLYLSKSFLRNRRGDREAGKSRRGSRHCKPDEPTNATGAARSGKASGRRRASQETGLAVREMQCFGIPAGLRDMRHKTSRTRDGAFCRMDFSKNRTRGSRLPRLRFFDCLTILNGGSDFDTDDTQARRKAGWLRQDEDRDRDRKGFFRDG